MKTVELVKVIEDKLKEKGALTTKIGHACAVDAGFNDLVLERFNKITTHSSSMGKMYVLSFEPDLKGLKQAIEVYEKKKRPENRRKQGVVKNPTKVPTNRLDVLAAHTELITSLFSPEFLNKIDISPSALSEQLEALALQFKPNNETPLEVFRLVEKRDGQFVGLVISPQDLSLKVAVTAAATHAFPNPLTSFYEDKFEPFAFNVQAEKHHLQFMEKIGFEHYPMAHNNLQVFRIVFDCYNVEGFPFDIFAKSGRTQIRFVNELMALLFICLGSDISSKSSIDRDTEYQVVDVPEIPGLGTVKDVRLYEAERYFSDPFFDFSMRFGPQMMQDDDGNEFMVAAALSSVFPFLFKDELDKGWQHHPIVYEAGK